LDFQFRPCWGYWGSAPGVQFKTLARSMNSSLLMSPLAKRSARIFLASASGALRLPHGVPPALGGGPKWPRRTRKKVRAVVTEAVQRDE